MSPTMLATMPPAPYVPRSDRMDRHEWAINKSRKPASTGGGRAWSEDEEIYLVQTRQQKTPYKHIAAYLKKTELACRLHYHQLSHGSNRRNRMNSISSSSSGSHSPVMTTTMPETIRESPTRSVSPAGSHYSLHQTGYHLPSISESPRLPAILPKPSSSSLPPLTYSPALSTSARPPNLHREATSTPASGTSHMYPSRSANSTPLRLDCSMLPPPTQPHYQSSHSASAPIDMTRLQAVYAAHRTAFWSAIAAEYGNQVTPSALEHAWRSSSSTPPPPHGLAFEMSAGASPRHDFGAGSFRATTMTPLTYCAVGQTATPVSPQSGSPIEFGMAEEKGQDARTRISAILGH